MVITILDGLSEVENKKTIHHEFGHFISWYNEMNWDRHIGIGNAMYGGNDGSSEGITEADREYAGIKGIAK